MSVAYGSDDFKKFGQAHSSLREVRAALQADRNHWRTRGHRSVYLQRGYHAAWLYRLSRFAYERNWRIASWFLWIANIWWTGADITPSSRVGGGLYMPHPAGVVIAGTVGRYAAISKQVVIGGLFKDAKANIGGGAGLPLLGDSIIIEARAIVLGAVRIGNRTWIGPSCVVRIDIEPGSDVNAEI